MKLTCTQSTHPDSYWQYAVTFALVLDISFRPYVLLHVIFLSIRNLDAGSRVIVELR